MSKTTKAVADRADFMRFKNIHQLRYSATASSAKPMSVGASKTGKTMNIPFNWINMKRLN
jgi:hypothetical protein